LEFIKEEAMYAYNAEGRLYDAGDKLGYLESTVEYELINPNIRDGFIDYLRYS
jgi:UTP--glucose-1-phosphate uridylyltransferase